MTTADSSTTSTPSANHTTQRDQDSEHAWLHTPAVPCADCHGRARVDDEVKGWPVKSDETDSTAE